MEKTGKTGVSASRPAVEARQKPASGRGLAAAVASSSVEKKGKTLLVPAPKPRPRLDAPGPVGGRRKGR